MRLTLPNLDSKAVLITRVIEHGSHGDRERGRGCEGDVKNGQSGPFPVPSAE